MKSKHRDITGKFYGRLTALKHIGTKHDCALWLFGCYCGNFTEKTIGDVRRTTKPCISCGSCYDVRKYPDEYNTWRRMMQRCYNKDNKDYKNYGGRGITVCERWRCDFLYFLEDVGLKPEGYDISLDRKDNNGNYEKDNCRWTTRLVQNNNKRNTTYERLFLPTV